MTSDIITGDRPVEEPSMGIEIEVGGVYTHAKGIFAREILKISPDGMVHYRYYGLSDGAVISPQAMCSGATFHGWISRPLTPEERSRLQPFRVDDKKAEQLRGLVQKAVAAATDEMLLAEVRRRGLHA
jgi:hypothetical protein